MAERTLVIAEAGVNHDGVLDRALRLVDVAADAGADIVKFQTFRANLLATATAPKAVYQFANTGTTESQLDMLRRLELAPREHAVLIERCRARGIGFLSTAFDAESLAFLATLPMPVVKIPSGDLTCAPLLLQAARIRRRLIVSTGMATLGDIEAALGVIAWGLTRDDTPRSTADVDVHRLGEAAARAVREQVTLLHCVTQYPAPPHAVNLRAMETMAAAFGVPVGYSDHTLGIEVALAAVARGATVIEKHFTLDRSLPGPDHAASLEPDELKRMVAGIRTIEAALGSPCKAPAPEEMSNRDVARRSVVAARAMRAGEPMALDALACKRPGTGISPIRIWDLAGRPARRDYGADEAIEP
jgi:N-acetylneuraminate synthase